MKTGFTREKVRFGFWFGVLFGVPPLGGPDRLKAELRTVILVAFCIAVRSSAAEEPATNSAPSTPSAPTANQDHQRMMDLLNISTLRPGRKRSNPQSPSYANYDQAKANPFPDLPAPLVLKNGTRITTAEQWWNHRRPEIAEDFD